MSANGDGNMQIDIPKATGLDSITNKIYLGGAILLGIGIVLFIYKKNKK